MALEYPSLSRKIERLDRDFHLMMIRERFDESLVLLAHLLCLPLTSMVALKQNQRLKEALVQLSPDEKQILERHQVRYPT
jgi:hypothetical protein